MPALRRRVGLTVATLLASAAGAAVPHYVVSSPSASPTSTPTAEASTPAAKAALTAARRLFAEPTRAAYRASAVPSAGAREATLALRDLRLALPGLLGDDAQVAARLLSRPTEVGDSRDDGTHYDQPSKTDCTAHLCVHWVERGRDAVVTTDGDGDGVPDWVETTQRTLETAWRHFGNSGYKAPLSDASLAEHGPDGKVDVYLADVASLGFYGYCAPDDMRPSDRTAPGFCVLDNDYSYDEVSTEPIVALRATAAHELFHLVQFAYDAREDPWLMEGTATWMEDEVFDTANDNWNYLSTSTLAHPGVPIDYGEDYYPYGAWTWWRFLSEYFGSSRKAAPQVIRQVWEAAVTRDSLTATRSVISHLGTSFPRSFADYSALSHVSRRWYFEGADAPYPQAPMARQLALSRRVPGTGAMRSVRLDHLTSANISISRSSTLAGRNLRIWVDGPSRLSAPAVEVTLHRSDGTLAWRILRLDADGDGALTVPFARGKVGKVVVTLVNTSTRMSCGQSTTLGCGGVPKDDGRTFSYRARSLS